MKRFNVVAGLAAGLLMTSTAFAQSSVRLEIEVPFSFAAGNLQLPAGNYLLKADAGTCILWFVNRDTRKVAMVMTGAPTRGLKSGTPHAKFNVYGTRHYLASIWSPNAFGGYEVPQSAAEREAVRAGVPAKVEVLVASYR